jgi:hypothetical protein
MFKLLNANVLSFLYFVLFFNTHDRSVVTFSVYCFSDVQNFHVWDSSVAYLLRSTTKILAVATEKFHKGVGLWWRLLIKILSRDMGSYLMFPCCRFTWILKRSKWEFYILPRCLIVTQSVSILMGVRIVVAVRTLSGPDAPWPLNRPFVLPWWAVVLFLSQKFALWTC